MVVQIEKLRIQSLNQLLLPELRPPKHRANAFPPFLQEIYQ